MQTNLPAKSKSRPPATIAIAGWILFIGAIVNLGIGTFFIVASNLITSDPHFAILVQDEEGNEMLSLDGQEIVQGAINIVLGLVEFVITIGFWSQQRWAWVAGISWQAVKLLFEIASISLGGGTFVGIFFAALLVFLLNQADVRRAFQLLPQDESSPPTIRTLNVN